MKSQYVQTKTDQEIENTITEKFMTRRIAKLEQEIFFSKDSHFVSRFDLVNKYENLIKLLKQLNKGGL